jgi:hypothetical protein
MTHKRVYLGTDTETQNIEAKMGVQNTPFGPNTAKERAIMCIKTTIELVKYIQFK